METDSDNADLLREKRGQAGQRVKYFSGRASVGLGSTMIVLGCLAIIAQVIVLAVYNRLFNSISQGIWCGIAFIICGIFGIIAGKRKTIHWILTHLILCVIVCFFAAAIIGLSTLSSITNFGSLYTYQATPCDFNYRMYDTGGYHNYNMNDYSPPCYYSGRYVINIPWLVQLSMNALMGFIGILSAVIAVIAATLSCAPLCCNPDREEEDTKPLCSPAAAPLPLMTNVCIVPSEPAAKTDLLINIDAPTDVNHI